VPLPLDDPCPLLIILIENPKTHPGMRFSLDGNPDGADVDARCMTTSRPNSEDPEWAVDDEKFVTRDMLDRDELGGVEVVRGGVQDDYADERD
jgi:hypothetical protein